MIQRIDVPVPMRDGVSLSVDYRLPDGPGPFPAALRRTPYGNSDMKPSDSLYLKRGYAVVSQDCRGRFDSEGRFNPMREDADGFDTLAWLRVQPWCDGRVGMTGSSYSGYTQFAAAWTRPEGLMALAPSVISHNLFKECIYHNGVPNLTIALGWGSRVAGRTVQRNQGVDWDAVYRHLPLLTMGEALGYDLPYFKDWLQRPVYDATWAEASVERHFGDIDVPVLQVGGWYDVYANGVFQTFLGLSREGGPRARGSQKVVVGPWTHSGEPAASGQLDFGAGARVDTDALKHRWHDRWVKGDLNGVDEEPPIRIFVMGENVWRDEAEWPPARAKETAFYLSSGGAANSLFGNGALSRRQETGAESDGYAYDPDLPVPTLGGQTLGTLDGPADHRPIERRDDVLCYTTEALEAPLEATGFVKAILYASTDAPDTDFVARLCDVHPGGRSLVLCDGIVRLRYREGLDRETLAEPGKVYEMEVPMSATSNVFLPGHRVRLEVTSSCFPRWGRTLITGEPVATGVRVERARQRVFHSPARPSRLVLPVVERDFA